MRVRWIWLTVPVRGAHSRKPKVNAEQDQDEDDSFPEAEWGSPPKDKVTMRTYYKSIR